MSEEQLLLKAWQNGLRVFPDNTGLKERVAFKSPDEALDYVERARTLDQQIDTDFSFHTESSTC
jgi:hypothetical protein